MAEPLSPLRYPGGKSALTPLLAEIIRVNGLGNGVYVEPYAGGAGAALGLLMNEHVRRIVINDLDYRVYCFWWSILNRPKHFLQLLSETRITMTEWRRQSDVYRTARSYSRTRVGFATFFLNRCNRSGILVSGGPIGGYRQEGKYLLNARFNKRKLRRRIERLLMYRERIELHNRDATDLLRNIVDRRTSATDTLVYLDPPYFGKGDRLYLNAYSPKDHQRLATFLARGHRFKWLLSYDNNAEIASLYQRFKQVQFDLTYTAYERRSGRELLIYPPDLKVPADAIEEVAA